MLGGNRKNRTSVVIHGFLWSDLQGDIHRLCWEPYVQPLYRGSLPGCVTLAVASVSLISDTDKLTGCVLSVGGPGDRLCWAGGGPGDTRPIWM